jgi:hypothetical protein
MNYGLHEVVGELGKSIGIPDSCIEKVVCFDCGEYVMAAQCKWIIGGSNGTTGPHCGCK